MKCSICKNDFNDNEILSLKTSNKETKENVYLQPRFYRPDKGKIFYVCQLCMIGLMGIYIETAKKAVSEMKNKIIKPTTNDVLNINKNKKVS